jgi:uncharacterized protein YdaU (DUF1376 family)
MASALPYMKFYPTDYLSDTQHLSTLEHGAYMLLIINYWQRGAPIPDDDKRLSGIARMSVEQWLNVRPTVVDFFVVEGGFWRHKRIDTELLAVAAKSKKASQAGKISANKRLKNNGNLTFVEQTPSKRSTTKRPFNHTDTDTDTELPIHEEINF